MDHPPEIAFHGLEPGADIEARLHNRIERLERLAGRLVSCRVVIDAPHKSQRTGGAYDVRVEARGPEAVFVVDRAPGDDGAHKDLHVALRDAFDALERQVKRWKETHRGRPVVLDEPLRGRVAMLMPEEGWGEVALADGRMVYFHRNAVAEDGFDALEEEAAVEVSLDPGEDSEAGPHASHVRPIPESAAPRPGR